MNGRPVGAARVPGSCGRPPPSRRAARVGPDARAGRPGRWRGRRAAGSRRMATTAISETRRSDERRLVGSRRSGSASRCAAMRPSRPSARARRAAQRNSAIARSAGQIDRSSRDPRRSAISDATLGGRAIGRRATPGARSRVTDADMSATVRTARAPRHPHHGTIDARHSAGAGPRLYSAAISTLHTRYASRSPRGAPWPARPARRRPPRPATSSRSCPGPKARAHVAFDETWTSPSLPRAYPIVPVRGEGLTVEDIDGNLFLDFAAGIAVNSTGHSHPQVVAGDQGAGGRADPLLRQRLLPADLPGGLPPARASSRRSRARPASTSATPGPRSSRRRSSSPATRRSGRTSSPSSARSTAGPTARSR